MPERDFDAGEHMNYIPKTQQAEMHKHIDNEERKAARRMKEAKNYEERKRAEGDLEGAQRMRSVVQGWPTR